MKLSLKVKLSSEVKSRVSEVNDFLSEVKSRVSEVKSKSEVNK